MAGMPDISLIDISACDGNAVTAPEKIVAEVEAACRDIGFLYLTGHGVDPAAIACIRAVVRAYFELPLEQKLRERICRDNYRGFIPPDFFSANSGDLEADTYEGYKLHTEIDAADPICDACDLYGPNKWPGRSPGFRQAVLDYWQQCDRVAHILLRILARILAIDPVEFLQLFEKPLTNMTLLHYPSVEEGSPRYGIHPHKDTDALTILAPDPVGGLMVRCTGQAEWLAADAPGDALVVNTGDLLELWSGGYFVSTPHKVVNHSGAERYSFPYFAVPRFDTVVEPLVAPQPGFMRDSVHVGDVSREVWRTNWPDAVPDNTGFELGTLKD